jgi:hypothetical protein
MSVLKGEKICTEEYLGLGRGIKREALSNAGGA